MIYDLMEDSQIGCWESESLSLTSCGSEDWYDYDLNEENLVVEMYQRDLAMRAAVYDEFVQEFSDGNF